jgi:ribosomal protein S18 acetylase RimI-like enzyme
MARVSPVSELKFIIRSFKAEDAATCRRLYRDGLLGGTLSPNDSGLDIDDIAGAYMKAGNHFWVAEAEGKVVGMIGVQQHEENIGEIRRLRVSKDFRRRGIASRLLDTAIHFCQEQQYLKVMLDTFTEREGAVKLFEKFGFRHSRTKKIGEKDLMYFYLDLYHSDRRRRH